MILSLDFETRSPVHLPSEGAHNYALHKDTGIYNLAYAFDDDEPKVWHPGEKFPESIAIHFAEGGDIAAWNAQFERLIITHVLSRIVPNLPIPDVQQYYCSAARAAAHGLPRSLENCTRAIGTGAYKNPEGRRLIRDYCSLNILWEHIPEADQDLMDLYAISDVNAERSVTQVLRELADNERYEYAVNEHINDYGVPVDLPMARAALEYASEVRADVDAKMLKLTCGQVASTRDRKSRDAWLLPMLNAEQIKLITRKADGVDKISFDQDHREALALHPDLPQAVGDYIKLVDEAGGATIAKYTGISNRAVDGRVPGTLIWNGAGQTGRFSSTGLQMHNLRRDSIENPEPVIQDLIEGYELPDVTTTLARLVRSTIFTPNGLTWFDWSSIEGRVAPWLADSAPGRAKLELYTSGTDPYVVNAASYFNVDYCSVTKRQRQMGKVQELSLQFLGGKGALKLMARNYKIHLDDDQAQRMVDSWRNANPWARTFGDDLDVAAMSAVANPKSWYAAGKIRYCYDGGDWLWCQLPSGRLLAYFQPKREFVISPWGTENLAVTCLYGSGRPKVGEDWPRRDMHGGIWLENVVQAVAADILREAIIRVDDAGLDIVLHVHDEVVVEGYHLDQLSELMLTSPDWAKNLPIAGDGGTGTRYGK